MRVLFRALASKLGGDKALARQVVLASLSHCAGDRASCVVLLQQLIKAQHYRGKRDEPAPTTVAAVLAEPAARLQQRNAAHLARHTARVTTTLSASELRLQSLHEQTARQCKSGMVSGA